MSSVMRVTNLSGEGSDCVVLVTSSLDLLTSSNHTAVLSPLKDAVQDQLALDSSAAQSGCVVGVKDVAGARVVYAPTGPLDRDYDDARRWTEAAAAGVKRALGCGCSRPLLVVIGPPSWPTAALLSVIGALETSYVPLEIREDVPAKKVKVEQLAVFDIAPSVITLAQQLDAAKSVAKDIGGSDPERMAPPRVAQYVKDLFHGSSSVSVEVITDDDLLCREYPLFSAVNRCAKGVERHRGCIIYLTYTPPDTPTKSLFLVGKGVTYDTGGADIKAGGVMAGMHRDKCGSAGVAGYFKFLDVAKPKGIKVEGAMCMVRNSVGSDCYVSDEIITSRAGVRVRIGNTDAEGRMAMADVLARMKEIAQGQPDPHLFTVATLTGHCCLAMGDGYTAIMDNGPAKMANVAGTVQQAGEAIAEPVEVSSIRREDYSFHAGKSEYEDVLQSNNLPSSRTPRGHQSPAAFLILASGLAKHGRDSSTPLKYSHVDIAASAGPFPGLPTGAPVLAFARAFSPELFQ
ncbi:Peptidase M17 leucyl aminopeptidase C-terminal [Trinorchestia longiramus]|nr:Peptidase M17 leucyl aminopeptidase C-terminal [Trinorchestia longiramus]